MATLKFREKGTGSSGLKFRESSNDHWSSSCDGNELTKKVVKTVASAAITGDPTGAVADTAIGAVIDAAVDKTL